MSGTEIMLTFVRNRKTKTETLKQKLWYRKTDIYDSIGR